VHLRDLGDRALFTWREIGSFRNPTIPFTFQMQLGADGKVIFAYRGIPRIGSANIGETVHVGLTPGGLPAMPPGAEADYLGQAPFACGTTVAGLFPVDGIFSLDLQTIVFDPAGPEAYQVSVLPPGPVGPGDFSITGMARVPGGLQVRWASQTDVLYAVQAQTVPGGAWSDLDIVPGSGPETVFTQDGPPVPEAFYRIAR
jgi:hypothetical protein